MDYVEMFNLLMLSIKLFSKTDNIDFLVFTSKEFELHINNISELLEIPIKIKLFNFTDAEEAFCARLFIYDYEHINNYDKILYIDTDILIQADLTTLFNLHLKDKIYVCEKDLNEEDLTTMNKNTYGISTGVLLFKNSSTIQKLFSDILSHMSKHRKNNVLMPEYWDKSFINYYIVKNNVYNNELLKSYIFLIHTKEYPISPLKNNKIIINHFYVKKSKLQNMKYHMDHILKLYEKIIIPHETNIKNILYKQYTWENGRILFHKDDIIITCWGKGTYKMINTHIIEATWHNRIHLLIFNSSFTKYTSVRLDDIRINSGIIDTSLQDTIPISSLISKPRNLVYFCAFHNKGYIDLLKILLSCVKIFSKTDTIDFLVFTSESFRSTIEEISSNLEIPIKIQIFDFTTQHEAGCARLFIFSYKYIDNYDKILYLDTDIVIQNDISRIFDLPIEDKLYATQEYDINGEGHGAWFFDFTKFDPATPAINSGVLLFQNTRKMRKIFNDINIHISDLKKTDSIIPNCMDQSFIVYHFFRNNACDSDLMKKYVYLSEHIPPPFPSTYSDITMIHFVWPIGNTGHKLNRMIEHTRNLFNNYTSVSKSIEPHSVDDIINKKFTWVTKNSIGDIIFTNNNTILTIWGIGEYKQLDKYTIHVSWHSHSHILKMNSTFTSYIGFNTGSIDYIYGKRV